MKVKLILTTAALALAPAFAAYAQCSGHERQGMTCAEGHAYDEAKGACVVISS